MRFTLNVRTDLSLSAAPLVQPTTSRILLMYQSQDTPEVSTVFLVGRPIIKRYLKKRRHVSWN